MFNVPTRWRENGRGYTIDNLSDLLLISIFVKLLTAVEGVYDLSKDFHEREFDEGTQLKLDIFRGYIKEWLPVFLSKKSYPEVYIVDYCAGPGRDIEGKKGSPLIILEEIENYLKTRPVDKSVNINVLFNEYDKTKYTNLVEETKKDISNVKLQVENQDFKAMFATTAQFLRGKDTACLIIIDQCGIKFMMEDVFRQVLNFSATDTLFFVSSSYIKRFVDEPEFDKYLPKLDKERIRKAKHHDIHRVVVEYYKSLIPQNLIYYLAPFSIKKGKNIYGVVFGSSDLHGLEKFLRVCWHLDAITGEANYNIDDDQIRDGNMSLFPEYNTIRKQDLFKKSLQDFLIKQQPTNKELYEFTLTSGFLPKHTNDILRSFENENKLQVFLITTNKRIKGAYYINYNAQPKVKFAIME
jgi:three-Cys-motif partner protein